jgi:hypothetical protein
MTLQQLEQRVQHLERQVAELRGESKPFESLGSVQETFGMFGGDAEFDDIVRLGRQYRDQVNAENE